MTPHVEHAVGPSSHPSGAPSQQGTMCPQVSQRWCEVSHRIGAPQLSQGASPPMVGWQAEAEAEAEAEVDADAVSVPGRESAVMQANVAAQQRYGAAARLGCWLRGPTAYGLLCHRWVVAARNHPRALRVGRSALVFAQHRLLAMPLPSRRLQFGERWSST